MPTEKTGGDAEGASQNRDGGVANGSQNGKPVAVKRDPALTARDELLKRMDEQIVQDRADSDEDFFQSGDPRAIALAAEMGRESRGERIAADRSAQGRDAAAGAEAELISQEAGEAAAAEGQAAAHVQPTTDGDPLEEYVVREAGKLPMFRTVVDGKVHLVPLDRARQQLQKHLAADIRLQQAAEQKRQLDAREAQIRSTETALRTRAAPPVQPVDDSTLERESVELVRSLVSEPEAVAAQKLAKTLKSIRASAPQIDVDALSTQAAQKARQTIAAEDGQRALSNGLTEFTTAYPDISADPDLFALADRRTVAIAEEHKDWSPGKVMMEAGKQTREWLAVRSGRSPTPTPGEGQPNKRQIAKQNLKPMPQSRSARPAVPANENDGQSPQDALNEIRKSRGQPY